MTDQPAATARVGAWRREPRTVIRHAVELPTDAPAAAVIVSESLVAESPIEWEPHAHPRHELVWVRGGSCSSRIGDSLFTISDGAGLWIPAGVVHAGRLTAGVRFFNAFFDVDRSPVAFPEPTAVEMTPLLESLLTHLAAPGLSAAARERAESVAFDVIEPSATPLSLTMPGDPRIDAIAAALIDDPADDRSLADWATQLAISERSIARAFRRATGLSFVQWRRAIRVHEALSLLGEGVGVRSASAQLGYAQPSTFIAAFKRVVGVTPGEFLLSRSG